LSGSPLRKGSAVAAFICAVALAGCDGGGGGGGGLPPVSCPAPPTKWMVPDYRAIGQSSVGTTPTRIASGSIVGNVAELDTSSSVSKVFVYLERSEIFAAGVRAVIYPTDSAGTPNGKPLAVSDQLVIDSGPPRWRAFTLPAVQLALGKYFVGIWTGGAGTINLFATAGASPAYTWTVPYDATAPPPSWAGTSTGATSWSLYALYNRSPALLDPASYTPAPRSTNTSIDLEMGQLYLRRRITTALQATGIDNPSPDAGMFVRDLRLEERTSGSEKVNVLNLNVEPWVRGAQNQPVSLQRFYRVVLKITPYLLTPSTEPDAAKRRTLLGGANSGLALRFELIELYNLSFGRPVNCSRTDLDLFDAPFLDGLQQSLSSQVPLVIPTSTITDVAAKLTGSSPDVSGVNLGSDLDLKIGFALSGTAGRPFEPQTSLSRFPGSDWAINIDTLLVASAIDSQVRTAITSTNGLSVIGTPTIAFVPGGLNVDVSVRVSGCGYSTTGSVSVEVEMMVRRIGPDGPPPLTRYVIRAPQTTKPALGVFGTLCYLVLNPMGSATLTIGPGCFDVLSVVQFEASPGDWFYATSIDTDNVFYIAGRSSYMDMVRANEGLPPRPAVPPC
jgi:hypothetical protein